MSAGGARALRALRIWSGAIVALAFGAAIFAFEETQHARLHRYVERRSEVHLESVVALVKQGMTSAAQSIDQLYASTEAQLESTARYLGEIQDARQRSEAIDHEQVVVWLQQQPSTDAELRGVWIESSDEAKAALVQAVLEQDEAEILEDGPAASLKLYCAHYALRGGRAIACRRVDALRQLRKERGLAPLLDSLGAHGVAFLAIQDPEGIIAGTPNADRLSAWEEDAFLEQARSQKAPAMTYRQRAFDGRPVVEGAGLFRLPDGTDAVIRVGIDATDLARAHAQIDHGRNALILVVLALISLSAVASILIGRREAQRARAEQRLAAAESEHRHWLALGQMAATVAHEVRNPLNTLGMAAQRLEREFDVGPADRDEYNSLVRVLRSESDRVERVVGEFLDLGRPLRLTLEQAPAHDIVHQTADPLRLRAEREGKTLEIDNRCDGLAEVDRQRFTQIVRNLVENALDAVAEGGRVLVRSSCGARGLEVAVIDNGSGMSPETLEHALEPFVTTKAKGTGLGLPLAKRYAEAHGGTLHLRSELGKGTTALLVLPRPNKGVSEGVKP